MQRMNRKQRRDKPARPQISGHLREQQEEQQHCNRVQKHVREMMTARFQIEQLDIDHVRDRRERVPIVFIEMRERPADSRQAQSARNLSVFVNVFVVVVVHEIVAERLAKDGPRERDQNGADRESQSELGAHNCVELSWTLPERKQDVDLPRCRS